MTKLSGFTLGKKVAATIGSLIVLTIIVSSLRPKADLSAILSFVLIVFTIPIWYLLGEKKFRGVKERIVPHEDPRPWLKIPPFYLSEEKLRKYLMKTAKEQKDDSTEEEKKSERRRRMVR